MKKHFIISIENKLNFKTKSDKSKCVFLLNIPVRQRVEYKLTRLSLSINQISKISALTVITSVKKLLCLLASFSFQFFKNKFYSAKSDTFLINDLDFIPNLLIFKKEM